jgi:hypothetical protein
MSNRGLLTGNGIYVGAASGVLLAGGASLAGLATLPGGAFIVGGVGLLGLVGGLFLGGTSKKNGLIEYDIFEKLPGELLTQLETLQVHAETHRKAKSPLSVPLDALLVHAQELFKRINDKLDSQAGRLAAVNYTDTISKLNRAIAPSYYLDILAHNDLWDNAGKRLQQVETAVTATDRQLVENIRQVNASQDIDFSVALDSLVTAVENSSPKDMLE